MKSVIPIENLYYLFCYAWGHFPEGGSSDVGFVESPHTLDLFAQILIRGCRRILRGGLDRGYVEQADTLNTIRGRIDFTRTLSSNLWATGLVACRYDELDRDVLHNQIIKTTIEQLVSSSLVEPILTQELIEVARRLRNITAINIRSHHFGRVLVPHDRRQYRLMLKVCELLFHLRLPTEGGTGARFSEILDDETAMPKIFEQFVRNFYRHEQDVFRTVGSEVIDWQMTPDKLEFGTYLPRMQTDITLRSDGQIIVVDTKFYKKTLADYRGEKIYASHLYQLFAYLSNMEGDLLPDLPSFMSRVCSGLTCSPSLDRRRLEFSGI